MSKETFGNIIREAAVAYKTSSEITLVDLARKGISKRSLLNLAEMGSFSLKQLSELLPVSLRTLQRYNEEDLLPPEVSEHALLIAEVLARGMDVFDSQEKLQQWLHTPSVGLGSRTPLSLLDTSFGARMVTDELGRLEQGVYA